METEKILLDTDIGGDIDDAVCLAYLLREPRCRLMGITTVPAEDAAQLLPADSDLMRAVYDFGSNWLQSTGTLTLHDPLAAVSVFHPDLCTFRRGFVAVETKDGSRMAATAFRPDPTGYAEIADCADRDRFYRILSAALHG